MNRETHPVEPGKHFHIPACEISSTPHHQLLKSLRDAGRRLKMADSLGTRLNGRQLLTRILAARLVLEKTLDPKNENILQDIEVDIKKIGVQLKKIYENDKNDETDLDDKDLDRIKFLIDEMSKKHKQQKEFLTEFTNFIKNRKIN